MEKNKTGKYVKYAIGEILLVVIGILVALQVNNWNQTRIELNKEKQVLKSLKKELTENLIELNYDIKRVDSVYNNLNKLMKLLILGHSNNTNLDSLISFTLSTPTWNPSSYVLNDLKNSGKISQLTNLKLQEKLFTWERQYDNTIEYTQDFRDSNDKYIDFLRDKASLRNFDVYTDPIKIQPSRIGFNSEDLLNNLQFENYVDDRLITTSNLKTEYKEAQKIVEDLINSIEL
ncbi:DUF6090 family protein [Muriicola soli]|nr:DUF6090 family protein [Muriicola soli]